MSCLYCPDGAERCDWCDPRARTDRHIDRVNLFRGATATQKHNVKQGRHAMGHAMPGPEGETCGSCGHKETSYNCDGKPSWSKCALARQTGGKASDTRRRWPACARWESKQSAEADERDEANAARMP